MAIFSNSIIHADTRAQFYCARIRARAIFELLRKASEHKSENGHISLSLSLDSTGPSQVDCTFEVSDRKTICYLHTIIMAFRVFLAPGRQFVSKPSNMSHCICCGVFGHLQQAIIVGLTHFDVVPLFELLRHKLKMHCLLQALSEGLS